MPDAVLTGALTPLIGRFDSISAASNIVKQPYSLFRRILHALHQFIFVPDKNLEEGYAPKYRYWPIVSGCIVPVRYFLAFLGLSELVSHRTSDCSRN